MADSITRTSITQEAPPPSGKAATNGGEVNVEVPYLDYEDAHGRPFVADNYQLGDTWGMPNGGFPEEVAKIEEFIENQINDGEIANDVNDIRQLLRSLEKMTNVDKESRPLIKIQTVAAYVDFLNKTKGIKPKYGRA